MSSATTLRRNRPMVNHNSPRPTSACSAIRNTIEGVHGRHPHTLPQPDTPLGPYTQYLLEKKAEAELMSLHRVTDAFLQKQQKAEQSVGDDEECDSDVPSEADIHFGEATQPTPVTLQHADHTADAVVEQPEHTLEHRFELEDIPESPTPPTSTSASRASSRARSLFRSLTGGGQMTARVSTSA